MVFGQCKRCAEVHEPPATDRPGQRAEHYEMAAYGALIAWADAMGHTEASNLLQQTLY
jgi:hypothetical protein